MNLDEAIKIVMTTDEPTGLGNSVECCLGFIANYEGEFPDDCKAMRNVIIELLELRRTTKERE